MVPQPVSATVQDGAFTLTESTTIFAPAEVSDVVNWFRSVIGPATGCWLPPGDGGFVLDIDPTLAPEGYQIAVDPAGVTVIGGSAAGVHYGLQSVRQALPPAVFRAAAVGSDPWSIPAMRVVDEPRFGWRGVLLDVARHFMPKADLLRFLDLMAMHKLNVLHLHLTDDQGWRLQIRSWPRLTEVGSWRTASMVGPASRGVVDARPHGGFYTQDDIREIVGYAADRFIAVVPEVDMPGHMQAALAAYPELGNVSQELPVRTAWGGSPHILAVSDRALQFCRDVLDEVCELFPAEFVGIGGDEASPEEWRQSAAAKARVDQAGLTSIDELPTWFTAQMADHLRERGRRALAWDEIVAHGAADDVVIAAWHGDEATVGAVRAGHDVVTCPWSAAYLDTRQSDHPDEPIPVGDPLTVADVYALQPVPAGLSASEAARVIGVQANIWTEHMDSARVVDYMAFPRLCALAEVAWTGPGHDRADFERRLTLHKGRLRAYGVEYRHSHGPLPWQTRPDVPA
jgi:hexosaminidase